MVEILPFKGIVYNPKRFRTLSDVLSPPYDVITMQQREQLQKQSPYNMVRLILGKSRKSATNHSFYKSARENWINWRSTGILTQIPKRGVWSVKEHFSGPDGQKLTREGILAIIKLKQYSTDSIMGHEVTHKKPKEDRLRLLEHTHANLSPIFFIYEDSGKLGFEPISSFGDEETIHSRTKFNGQVLIESSLTTDISRIDTFTNYMKDKKVLIADGHHRYETALNFHKRHQNNQSLNSGYTLGYFVPTSSPGLIVYPTHRGIHSIPDFDTNDFLTKCGNYFYISPDNKSSDIRSSSFPIIRMITFAQKMVSLRIKPNIIQRLKEQAFPSDLAYIDVIILQEIILKTILGMTVDDISNQTYIKYYHLETECFEDLKNSEIQIAFLLSPIPMNKLFNISYKGGIMPQKTTYFYPKCPVGLVMHTLEKK